MTNEQGHPEHVCERCHGSNVSWFAPSSIWNAVHGDFDILCPVCFVSLAEAAGFNKDSWKIAPEFYNEPEPRRSTVLGHGPAGSRPMEFPTEFVQHEPGVDVVHVAGITPGAELASDLSKSLEAIVSIVRSEYHWQESEPGYAEAWRNLQVGINWIERQLPANR